MRLKISILEPYDFPVPNKIPLEWGDKIRGQLIKMGHTKVLMVCNYVYYGAMQAPGVKWAYSELEHPGMGWQRHWMKVNLGKKPRIRGKLGE